MPHTCHWPGCERRVPPKLLMCAPHWRRLPQAIRGEIWHTYRIGQEITRDPSPEYIAAARAALDWAHEVEQHERDTA